MDEEILRMQAMREGIAVRLNSLRGVTPEAPVPTPLLPQLPALLPTRVALDSLSLADRPMLAAGAARVEAAEAAARRASREIWPDVTLGVIYGQRPMMDGGTDRMGSFMLGFTLPLAAGSRQHQMTVEARAMAAMATADLADMRAETHGRIGELHADLTRNHQLRTLYLTTLLPQLRATATASHSAYQAGGTDFMTLLENEMGVLRAEQELIRYDADTGKAFAELEMLTATVLVDPASIAPHSGGTP
jgi:outer membrane protein TolC